MRVAQDTCPDFPSSQGGRIVEFARRTRIDLVLFALPISRKPASLKC